MSWLTAIWSVSVTACLMLATIHLALWYRHPARSASLGLAIALTGVAGIAVLELLLMRAGTDGAALQVLRWANVAVLVTLTGLIGFVRLRFKLGNLWLASGTILLRLVSTIAVFAVELPLQDSTLPTMQFLGEQISVVSALSLTPWWRLNEFSNLLFLLFMLEASYRLWRSGEPDKRSSALLVGGSIMAFTGFAAGMSWAIDHQLIRSPYLVSLPFLLVVAVLIYELNRQIAREISAREMVERELDELRARLARTERTFLLGQLSTVLVHELGQPLGAILRNTENAELLLRKPANDTTELLAVVEEIRRDDLRATTIITRMRALLDRRTVAFQAVILTPLLREVVALLRRDLESSRVRLELAPDTGLPPVKGEPALLQQVLMNLLSNSLEAMRTASGGVISITATSSEDAVELCISDDGPGVPDRIRSCLFEPFCSGRAKGTGIGLAIARTIIEAHQGRIWLDNQSESGATFRIRLPRFDNNETSHG
jgi:signal transduction histidine kinase